MLIITKQELVNGCAWNWIGHWHG